MQVKLETFSLSVFTAEPFQVQLDCLRILFRESLVLIQKFMKFHIISFACFTESFCLNSVLHLYKSTFHSQIFNRTNNWSEM